jgi:quercetin dioxygenase-like cupin family protein
VAADIASDARGRLPFSGSAARTLPLQIPDFLPVEQAHTTVVPNKHYPRSRDGEMIRCVRIWTGDDQNSHFEEGSIELEPGAHGDLLSSKLVTAQASFQETAAGGTLAWHTAPVRQLVITLSGTLDFQTRGGQHFMLKPGDILLAEDTAGGGHTWRLVDDQPWRRVYVVLGSDVPVPFKRAE